MERNGRREGVRKEGWREGGIEGWMGRRGEGRSKGEGENWNEMSGMKSIAIIRHMDECKRRGNEDRRKISFMPQMPR